MCSLQQTKEREREREREREKPGALSRAFERIESVLFSFTANYKAFSLHS
jgi:hypothetical protein